MRRPSPLGLSSFIAHVLFLALLLGGCSTSGRELKTPGPTRPPSVVKSAGTMDFTLPDATAVGELPDRHGAQFGNVAPPVSWGNVPDKAKFLILVVDIPKVDSGTDDASVLWLVANINPATDGVGENQPPGGDIYIPWAGPTTGRGAQVKVRFRLYAVTKPLADPTESPLDIVIRLDRTNVGKSEFVVPYAPKAAS